MFLEKKDTEMLLQLSAAKINGLTFFLLYHNLDAIYSPSDC